MVRDLFVKNHRGATLQRVEEMHACIDGIAGNVRCSPLRQVLLLPQSTIDEFALRPGDLRENIVISEVDLHLLSSGTVLQIGTFELRLTLPCEPCTAIRHIVDLKAIRERRGVLGSITKSGSARIGAPVVVKEQRLEAIPVNLGDRIKWYLDKIDEPISVTTLVDEIGLSRAYCRAVPNILRRRPDIDPHMITFKAKSLPGSATSPAELEEWCTTEANASLPRPEY